MIKMTALAGLLLTSTSVMAADPAPAPNLFAGFYATLGAGYSVSNQWNYFADLPDVGCCVNPFAGGQEYAQGVSGVGALGFNATFGSLLVGIELSGRFGGVEFDQTHRLFAGFPPGQGIFTYSFKSDAAAHVSGRVGGVFGDTLLFSKVGIGATRIEQSASADLTGFTSCVNFNFPCPGFVSGGVGSASDQTLAPSVLFGIGLEHNFGRLFVRAGAELERVFVQSISGEGPMSPSGTFGYQGSAGDGSLWIGTGTASVGVRF